MHYSIFLLLPPCLGPSLRCAQLFGQYQRVLSGCSRRHSTCTDNKICHGYPLLLRGRCSPQRGPLCLRRRECGSASKPRGAAWTTSSGSICRGQSSMKTCMYVAMRVCLSYMRGWCGSLPATTRSHRIRGQATGRQLWCIRRGGWQPEAWEGRSGALPLSEIDGVFQVMALRCPKKGNSPSSGPGTRMAFRHTIDLAIPWQIARQ